MATEGPAHARGPPGNAHPPAARRAASLLDHPEGPTGGSPVDNGPAAPDPARRGIDRRARLVRAHRPRPDTGLLQEPGAAIGAGFFVAVNLALLVAAISRIRAARFAGDRRASVRFDVRLPGRLSGRRCIALDVSLTGAQVVVPNPGGSVAARLKLEIEIDGQRIALACIARRIQRQPDGSLMAGLAFAPGQRHAVRRLAVLLFRADDAAWRSVPAGKASRRPSTRRERAAAPIAS